MAVKPVPEGHNNVSPYLIVPGAGKLIEFLQKTFGAQELFRFGKPDGGIGHAEVKIGDSVIMLSDATPEFPATACMVHVYVDDVDAVYRRGLQAGAASVREPADQFYGDRSAGFSQAGVQWWIATHKQDLSMEEMNKRAKEAGR